MPRINPSLAHQLPNPMFRLAAMVHGRTDIVHLEFGEPDFPTPDHIVRAAEDSLANERQGYGPGNGIPALRTAIAARVARVNHFAPAAEQVIVTAGGTGALFSALLCTCAPGDEVLVPDPAWAGYDGMLAAVGARTVRFPLVAEAGWQPDLDALEAAVTPRARVLLINSPSNPGGAVYPRDTMKRLLDVSRRHHLWLLSDAWLREVLYEGEHVSPALLDDTGPVVNARTRSK